MVLGVLLLWGLAVTPWATPWDFNKIFGESPHGAAAGAGANAAEASVGTALALLPADAVAEAEVLRATEAAVAPTASSRDSEEAGNRWHQTARAPAALPSATSRHEVRTAYTQSTNSPTQLTNSSRGAGPRHRTKSRADLNFNLCGHSLMATSRNMRSRAGQLGNIYTKSRQPMEATDVELLRRISSTGVPQEEAPPGGRAASCALVSTAGALVDSKLGKEIDGHEMVIRINWGGAVLPVTRPEDYGNRTNVIFMGHKDFNGCTNNCRTCVPHVLHPAGRRPRDRLQMSLVILGNDRGNLRKFAHCREQLGDDAWRLQLLHPDFVPGMDGTPLKFIKKMNGRKLSGGMIAFTIAMSMCDSVKPYGFFGITKGKPYHGYNWCDVDRVFGVQTKDCLSLRSGDAVKQTANGYKVTNSYHDFDSEKHAIGRRALQRPSEHCRETCDCF